MSDPMRSYSVTITMTPRQAVEADEALGYAAMAKGSSRLYSAAHRITVGLWNAGWVQTNLGTDDAPKWVWLREDGKA